MLLNLLHHQLSGIVNIEWNFGLILSLTVNSYILPTVVMRSRPSVAYLEELATRNLKKDLSGPTGPFEMTIWKQPFEMTIWKQPFEMTNKMATRDDMTKPLRHDSSSR
jgi:hypothetical protein